MNEQVSYRKQWVVYRKRRWRLLFISIGFIPGVLFAHGLSIYLFNSAVFTYVVAILWILAEVISWLYVIFWECPRYAKSYFTSWPYGGNVWARKYVRCKLPKWAEYDVAE